MANFEKFKAIPGARIGSYYAGITQNGTITFYTGFYQQEALSAYKSAALWFDKQEKLIGVSFSKEHEEGNLKLHHSKAGKNASIAASSFFKYYGLDVSNLTGRYKPTMITSDDGNDIFTINTTQRIT
ncbi:MAG: hypothetical protein HY396_01215 [Candidatus Doudnabacteria bacterium]|nr:hypothetical protein [Candidatus Doudnabacteria bacterium]